MDSTLPRTAVLCDFDGTATPCIVMDALYRRYAAPSWEEVTARWERGEIGTRQEIETNFSTITAGRAEMERFLDTVPLDPGFRSLVDLCRERGHVFALVSDGLTWYINHVLDRHGIQGVRVYANEVYFEPEGFRFSFPWYSEESPKRATSKVTLVRQHQALGMRVVFIGDGLSDVEVAGVADVLYARDALLAYCQERGIPARPFVNLEDVLAELRAG